MSRIGKKPISVPQGVEVRIANRQVVVKGKNGELSFTHHPRVKVAFDEAKREIVVNRPEDDRDSRALHGLTRSLINNMVSGVVNHFERKLEIIGVGYNASLAGKVLKLQVGFANTVEMPIPAGVICEVPDNTHVVVKGADKQQVGQFAANVRAVKPPEPYKGKGIRYQDEYVKRKAGKAFASGG